MAKTKTASALKTYRDKRDFAKSPEPQGKRGTRWKKTKNPIFVIQKHAASRLHYDFRLEVDGVLASWAVPKGPSTNPADKRLAVHVEDHPLDYADFEGVIPQGEYGGGTVIVWDAGPYCNIKTTKDGKPVPMQEAIRKGTVEVWLEGKKLRGGYALVRTAMGSKRGSSDSRDKKSNWLLIKMKDEGADPDRDPTQTEPASVLTGRTLEQVAAEESEGRTHA